MQYNKTAPKYKGIRLKSSKIKMIIIALVLQQFVKKGNVLASV